MGFVNKVMLMGNLTRDPELRQLPSGSTVCDFTLATNRVYKTAAGEEKQETVFADCTAFGRAGEVIAEYVKQGRPLFVEGRLHYETWEDKNGNRRSKLSVIVENFQFVGGRDEGSEREEAAPAVRRGGGGGGRGGYGGGGHTPPKGRRAAPGTAPAHHDEGYQGEPGEGDGASSPDAAADLPF